MNFDWRSIVKTVAPTIATALGGPLAGTATKYIADKFLGKPDASEEEISKAIQGATPEQLVQLKQIDVQFQKDMAQVGVDVYKIEVDDRKSAREREIQTHDWTPRVLAFMIIGAFLTAIFLIVGDGNITNTEESFMLLLSNLTTYVLAYYFGSSAGSRMKDYLNKPK